MDVLAGNVMRAEVPPLSANDTVERAAQVMRDENLGFLPICSRTGVVLGVITDRDICVRAAAEARDPATTSVSRLMSTPLVSCHESDTLRQVAELMRTHRVCRIVITDEAGGYRGVLSLADLAHLAEPLGVARVARDVFAREYRMRRSDRPGSVPP